MPYLWLIINHWGALLPHLPPGVASRRMAWCTLRVPPGLTGQTTGSVPRRLLAQEQQSWAAWERPPQNAPQAPTDEGEPEAGPCTSQGGSLHAHGLSPASGLGDCASQEHMFPRKPGIRLSQRAHPTISLSAVKVRNSFGYLPGFRKLEKKRGKSPWKDEAHTRHPINKVTAP